MKNDEVQKMVGNLTKKCESAESWQDYFVYMYIDVKIRPPTLLEPGLNLTFEQLGPEVHRFISYWEY